jgi:phosphate:Na+ symporter
MQSSHATLVLIITALAAGQITYENGLALAIGANVGTTITAIIGSMSSNIEGKRLAGAHLIFNLVTGMIAIAAIYPLMTLVDTVSSSVGIAPDNYTLKLAVFHTIFNLIGVIVMVPFIDKLVVFLERVLKSKKQEETEIQKAIYLNDSALEFPYTALKATLDESEDLMKHTMEIIAKGLGLDPSLIFSDKELDAAFGKNCCHNIIDIEPLYVRQLKGVYGEIVEFAIKAQADVSEDYITSFHNIKLANRNNIESVKMTEQLQHNLTKYLQSDNEHIREQYIKMIKRIAKLMRRIYIISQTEDKEEAMHMLMKAKKILEKNDIVSNGKLDKLIRGHLITNEMASSLMNDSAYTNNIIKSLIVSTGVLWVDAGVDIRKYREEIFSDKEPEAA